MSFKKMYELFRKLLRKFNNIHLKHKLLICYGGLIVFSVVFVGTFSYYSMKRNISDQTGELLQQMLVQQKNNIEDKLNTYNTILNQVASEKSLVFALMNQYTSPAEYSYEYLNTISEVLKMEEKDKNILGLYIFKNNETLPESGRNLMELHRAKGKKWFDTYFSDFDNLGINDVINLEKSYIWLTTDEYVYSYNADLNAEHALKIVLIKPIIYNHEKLIGVLELFLNYDTVFGEFIKKDNSSRDRIFISGGDHEIIFDGSTDEGIKSKLNDLYIRETAGKSEGKFQPGQAKKLILFSKGEKSGWTYFKELPLESLFERTKEVREVTVIIAVIGVVISFVIGITIASVLTRRIGVLLNKMKQVKDLSLNVVVDIDGKDEIGNLAAEYNQMIGKIKDLVEQLKTSQLINKEAEMKALQAQINPHFLYNTLATISWMAMGKNTDKIVTMVDSLSVFYRMSLNKGRSFLKVCDEIMQVKAYAYIQKVRLEDKINVSYDVQEDILQYYMPKLILQPFVENAILHGSEYKEGTTNIIVKGYGSDKNIIFEIIDDGVGMRNAPEPARYISSGGYGIRNVHEKIQLQFGALYGVQIFSKTGLGTKVSIILPAISDNPEQIY